MVTNERTLNESAIFRQEDVYTTHLEINQFGLIWFKESFWEETSEQRKGTINPITVLERLLFICLFGKSFYEQIGYWGALECELVLEGVKNKPLQISHLMSKFGGASLDNEIPINDKITVISLREELDSILSKFYKNFLWSCGVSEIAKNHTAIEEHIKEAKKG
ncbi:MAG: hypothetical protein OEW70_09460, partial [candidate division WOR-3 bacterium]|nr:hypothetical protein [candidate division WOR-3 bacterium]